eukprot:TRINITY_DN884_c0_g1_i2.p1 TRINITY_DN884_c0_g1~~TRINITY_DN884_c0_g1_i2.p1  ORF type:complete len:992 (-),score=351.14 TRINITY_DN884_c0_g1_i2:57-3032(-)
MVASGEEGRCTSRRKKITMRDSSSSPEEGESSGSLLPLKGVLTSLFSRLESMEEATFEREFSELKSFSEELKSSKDYSTSEGEKDVNRKKNRYKDILPFDYSRVILSDYPGIPGSDYINANYLKGASGSNAYIASQGPLPNTVNDFWRMIVECQVQVIVMACNEQEAGKHKCERYWGGPPTEDEEDLPEEVPTSIHHPDEEETVYRNYSVKLLKARRLCPDFLVRTMRLRWKNDSGAQEEKIVCQFHYSAWPDHGIPTQVKPLLEMVRLIRDCQASETLPVLVHCSAGCGRTGTICAIDFIWGLLRTGKLTSNFSLFELVKEMRKQRISIVQTVDQYILVHRAVRELFLEQLRVIDTHTYENVDNNGLPIYPNNNINLLSQGEESDTEYETVFVNEQNIDKILSEKLSTNLCLSSSSSTLLHNNEEDVGGSKATPPPPKQRYLESLNLESTHNVGTSASAAASTANSSDNLLEDFHRDISKSTSKLFEPAAPPESLRHTCASTRFKKGNLRLKKTEDGNWILEERELPEATRIAALKKKSEDATGAAPPLLRKPSVNKIKAYFKSNVEASSYTNAEEVCPPSPLPSQVKAYFQQQIESANEIPRFTRSSSPSHPVALPLRHSELDVSLTSKSVPNSLDRKAVRKSDPAPSQLASTPASSSSSSTKIKRSKSMKIPPISDHHHSVFKPSSYESETPSFHPPPKPKRLNTHEYANVHFSSSEEPPLDYVNMGFNGEDPPGRDSVLASFESAEKEGDRALLDNESRKFGPFSRGGKERRNSFRQAVDWGTPPLPHTYENILGQVDNEEPISANNPYEPIAYSESRNKAMSSSEGLSNNPLQSVGLVSEVIKQQRQQRRSNNGLPSSVYNYPGTKECPPLPPYKQPPLVDHYQQQQQIRSLNRIPHRHLPSSSSSNLMVSGHPSPQILPEPRVPNLHHQLNNNNNQHQQVHGHLLLHSSTPPPKLPHKENKVKSPGRNIKESSSGKRIPLILNPF